MMQPRGVCETKRRKTWRYWGGQQGVPWDRILACLQTSTVAIRLVLMMSSSSDSEVRLSSFVCDMPAQFTRTSTGPTGIASPDDLDRQRIPAPGEERRRGGGMDTYMLRRGRAEEVSDALATGHVEPDEAMRQRTGRGGVWRRRGVRLEQALELELRFRGRAAEQGEEGALASKGLGDVRADNARGPDYGAMLAREGQDHCGMRGAWLTKLGLRPKVQAAEVRSARAQPRVQNRFRVGSG